MRTGGILSLQHLASESDEYWPLVEEMLAVFIREHARHVDQPRPGRALSRGPSKYRRRRPSGPSQPIEEQQTPASPSSDVRVALRVLGKRPRPAPGTRRNPVDLSHLDLSEVDLQGANLDSVRFDGSILRGAQLSDASLSSVSLKGARLERAELSSADLSYADLQKASVTDAVFYEALMAGTKVWGCDLASMNLSDTQQKAVDLSDYRSGAET